VRQNICTYSALMSFSQFSTAYADFKLDSPTCRLAYLLFLKCILEYVFFVFLDMYEYY